MNLTTLAERACLESGYNDTDDIAAAKKFAAHWDEHIWNAALWKDALVAVDVSVDPTTNDDHAEGIIYLPEVIDRVVAVRSATNQILVHGQEHYYRTDFDSFTNTGTPVEFHLLPPAWFTCHLGGSGYVSFSGETADASVALKIAWLGSTGRKTTRTTTVGGGLQLTDSSDEKITVLFASKGATTGDVEFTQQTDTAIEDRNTLVVSGTAYTEVNGTYVSTDGGISYTNAASGATITYVPSGNYFRLDVGEWAYTANGTDPTGTWEVSNYSEPVPTVAFQTSTTLSLATLAAADTKSPSYARIRLLPIPTAAFTLKVLGKAKYEPLDFDQQEPCLRNLTNALLAYVRASLKRRGGEIGAAQLEFAEGNALLKQVADVEALQAANNQRFIPAEGYGPTHGVGLY